MAQKQQSDIRIRFYRPSDSNAVRELFWQAFTTGPTSPRCTALRESLIYPASLFAYALICIGLVLIAQFPGYKVPGAVASVCAGSFIFVFRRDLSNTFIHYSTGSLNDDLLDIASHYKMGPNGLSEDFAPIDESAFWVVECDLPNERGHERGHQIIGFIGLDCQMENGSLRAELRRMVVSPNYRKRGIATLLIKTLIARARNYKIPLVHLSTSHFQHSAIRLYEKYGWVETRKVPHKDGIVTIKLVEFILDLR